MSERPILFSGEMVRAILDGRKTQTRRVILRRIKDEGEWVTTRPGEGDLRERVRQEFRAPCSVGDRLWVRENWAVYGEFRNGTGYCYRADGHLCGVMWKPSIHMPRCASRLSLEVRGVRPERVQCMSEMEAREEGVASKDEYAALWDSLNGKRGYGWDKNPWVWVIDFSLEDSSSAPDRGWKK